jgi:hypothetical protein
VYGGDNSIRLNMTGMCFVSGALPAVDMQPVCGRSVCIRHEGVLERERVGVPKKWRQCECLYVAPADESSKGYA